LPSWRTVPEIKCRDRPDYTRRTALFERTTTAPVTL
jgi:hypothetical protein